MKRISNDLLLQRIETLVRRENEATLAVLQHWNEVESRRLHVRLGYASMFDFATRRLRYSAAAAGRRIQVARCLRGFPQLVPMFRAREVNLSTVGLVSGVLTDDNVDELLESIRGRSQREVEAVVAGYRPPERVRDSVRRLRVAPERRKCAGDREPDASSLFDGGRPGGGGHL